MANKKSMKSERRKVWKQVSDQMKNQLCVQVKQNVKL